VLAYQARILPPRRIAPDDFAAATKPCLEMRQTGPPQWISPGIVAGD